MGKGSKETIQIPVEAGYDQKYYDLVQDWHKFMESKPELLMRLGTFKKNVGPQEIWDHKDDWYKFEEESKEIWESMELTDRQIVIEMIRDALEYLLADLPSWVPESLTKAGGEALDVSFLILFGQIERDLRVKEIKRTEDLAQVKQELGEELGVVQKSA